MTDRSASSAAATSSSSRSSSAERAAERQSAIEQFAAWGEDPERFVLDNFGPEYEKLHNEPLVPDPWQKDALRALVEWDAGRFAYAASKNALKTCTTAWAGWWIIACHHNAQGYAISISGDQLETGLWKELSIWYALSPLLQSMFEMSATRIEARGYNGEAKRGDTWFLEARSWPKASAASGQVETPSLKGLHGRTPFALCDEAGDYPDGPVEALEGIFAGTEARPFLILAGNTPRQAGPLYRAVLNREGLYKVFRISGEPGDPKRCTRVSVKWAEDQLKGCGGDRTHPVYKINVLGEFPDVAFDKLLGPDDVDQAMRRIVRLQDFLSDPIVAGIDTADGGADSTSLIIRWGCILFRPTVWRIGDPMLLADAIASVLNDLGRIAKVLKGRRADAIFIDLGGQSGHGVQSRLKQLGYPAIGVDFGSPPVWADPEAPAFRNRRAEMGWRAARWVKSGGALPDDQLLRGELLEPLFLMAPSGKAEHLFEKKEAVKARLGRSPDRGDSFWLTHAAPVVPKAMREAIESGRMAQQQRKDPFALLGGRT